MGEARRSRAAGLPPRVPSRSETDAELYERVCAGLVRAQILSSNEILEEAGEASRRDS